MGAATVCYPKADPTLSKRTENETGYAKAFGVAAKALIDSKIKETDVRKIWTDAIEESRVAKGASPVAGATTNLEFKNNFDNEFIMAWAMLLIDTFDPKSEAQKLFKAGIVKTTALDNPLGEEFGKIYKDLTGDDLTKADSEIDQLCKRTKQQMGIPKV